MKKARIYAVTAATETGYAGRWKDDDSRATSADVYDLYFDCVDDARKRGYVVELTYAAGDNAPGGAGFRLRDRTKES